MHIHTVGIPVHKVAYQHAAIYTDVYMAGFYLIM